MGDDIQAIKAGLMEIGDLFVVNKADREGAGKTVRELKFMIQMSGERYQSGGWVPPVLETVAADDRGVRELYEALQEHNEFLRGSGKDELRRRERVRIRAQLIDMLKESIMEKMMERIGGIDALEALVDDIVDRTKDPYHVNQELLAGAWGGAAH
jgi:LAO/AO transport system kinase